METLFIADKEKNIRDSLKALFDWKSLGFELYGEAGNGKDALLSILQNSPSLVLLDTHMPQLSGLNVIKIAREQGYTGRFIILSSYTDFSYTQEAISYGVDFYLTKPVNKDALLNAIKSIKVSLEHEHQRAKKIALYQEKAKKELLHELVNGTWNCKQPDSLSLEDFKILSLIADVYQVVIYEQSELTTEDKSFSFAELLKITNNNNHSFEHFEEEHRDVILLKGDFALRRFEEFLDNDTMHSLFIAYGRPVRSLDEIYLSYNDAYTLIQRRFFCIKGQCTLGYMELPTFKSGKNSIDDDTLSEYCNALIIHIQTSNRRQAAQALSSLEEYLYNADITIDTVKLFLTDLLLQIKENINKIYGSSRIILPSNFDIIKHIHNSRYLYKIISYISEQSRTVIDMTENSSNDSILDDIVYYIDNNYQNNIKLETIAPLFGYNSAYLGKLFTKAKGENFNSYVDHRRIERSKRLLEQKKLKVYEISEQVGYKNVDYFHKKFKKYVGISPAEYRKQMQADID